MIFWVLGPLGSGSGVWGSERGVKYPGCFFVTVVREQPYRDDYFPVLHAYLRSCWEVGPHLETASVQLLRGVR